MSKLIRRTVRKGGGAALLIALQILTLTLAGLLMPLRSGPQQQSVQAPAGSQVQSSSSAAVDSAKEASASSSSTADEAETARPRITATVHELTPADKAALRKEAVRAKKLYEPLATQIF